MRPFPSAMIIIGFGYAAFGDSATATRPWWVTPVIIVVGLIFLVLVNLPFSSSRNG